MKRTIIALLAAALLLCGLNACAEEAQPDPRRNVEKELDRQSRTLRPYVPRNNVEFNNFNRAQELYDSPNTIIWCTAFPSNPSAPFITTPVAGKLTSSSVSYLPPFKLVDHGNYSWSTVENRSSDGMYHGSPPPYRYGFTPGGIYVDYFNIPTFCTTALTKFQREKSELAVTVDAQAEQATKAAEAALKRGDRSGAQRILNTLEQR